MLPLFFDKWGEFIYVIHDIQKKQWIEGKHSQQHHQQTSKAVNTLIDTFMKQLRQGDYYRGYQWNKELILLRIAVE